MKTEFEYNNKIIATADLEEPLYEDESVTIFGKEYVVYQNHHEVEIHNSGCEEKVICSIITEEEWEEWHK